MHRCTTLQCKTSVESINEKFLIDKIPFDLKILAFFSEFQETFCLNTLCDMGDLYNSAEQNEMFFLPMTLIKKY